MIQRHGDPDIIALPTLALLKGVWTNIVYGTYIAVSQQMVVHSLSCSMVSRLSTTCLSTVSPSPLTAVA